MLQQTEYFWSLWFEESLIAVIIVKWSSGCFSALTLEQTDQTGLKITSPWHVHWEMHVFWTISWKMVTIKLQTVLLFLIWTELLMHALLSMHTECISVEMHALAMHFIEFALQVADHVHVPCGVSFLTGKEVWYNGTNL